MKMFISMLLALSVTASTVGCGPDEVSPQPAPTPAPTCQKLKGTYATTSKVTSVTNDPTLCAGYEEGAVDQSTVTFDSGGNFASGGTAICTTSYANNNCNVKVDCVFSFDGGSGRYTIALTSNSDGTQFSGTNELTGSGFMCPRVAGTVSGIR